VFSVYPPTVEYGAMYLASVEPGEGGVQRAELYVSKKDHGLPFN